MKFVAYYRVSLQKQGIDGYGMAAQKEAVKRYLESLECELLGNFEEVESGANNQRPQLAAAIQLAKAKKAILVIAKLDRISRNASFLMKLQDSGVDFVACDMPNADKFTVGILALVAQRERELISERTKAGMAVARARGVVMGNPRAAEAWQRARIAIKRKKGVFTNAALESLREIQATGVVKLSRLADCMNKRGETTVRGGRWTATAVKRVLACS